MMEASELQADVIVEADDESTATSTALATALSTTSTTTTTPRRVSLMGSNRNRKKSRRMTLTSSLTASSSSSSSTDTEAILSSNQQDEEDRLPNIGISNQPADSTAVATVSSGSSIPPPPERKISRIFSILQSMQQTFFIQQQQGSSTPPHQPLVESPSVGASAGTISRTGSVLMSSAAQHNQPSSAQHHRQQQLFAMGQSQESMVGFPVGVRRTLRNPVLDRLNRFGSINSWTGSECSDVSSSTTLSNSAPPPLVHAVPYHKDGWTSLFIVGSSTYAQVLIVICIVSALSEVVTHNVPFLFFEGFFTYLYTMSIIFLLYVFGYLLRSRRRKELKRRQRKMSKWRAAAAAAASAANNKTVIEPQVNNNASSSTTCVQMEDDAGVVTAKPNRFISSFKNSRRRISRDCTSPTSSAEPVGHKTLEWTPSSLSLNVVDESTVSYAMSGANVITRAPSTTVKHRKMKVSDNDHSHGSFFLRAGAVAFGLGTMIYDGLEFGAFLEVPPESPCFALLRGLNPILHATFAFLQMYFIFISARLNIHKFKVVARFGIMHCLATNVCVWVRTLVRESLKEINGHYHHYEKKHKAMLKAAAAAAAAAAANTTTAVNSTVAAAVSSASTAVEALIREVLEDVASSNHEPTIIELVNETIMEALTSSAEHHDVHEEAEHPQQSLWELTGNISCGRRIFLGDVIMDAAPFLYPFLIEYSLIGAAVLYVVWAHIGLNPKYKEETQAGAESSLPGKANQLRVDCIGASKGLFFGLFFLTVSLLSLVLFFVFAPHPEFHQLGLFLADSTHCVLLIVSVIAMALGAWRARDLEFHPEHQEELGNILLRVSAIGIYAYSVFSMIAGALTPPKTEEPPLLVLINGLLSVIEVTAQMIFISDMNRRRVSNPEQDRTKPGRQTVTFLLISNLTLWLVYTFEMQKVEANPVQVNFYGFLPWAIVQRISLPLCIFYRFHSAIVYAEIWKNTYRYNGGAAAHGAAGHHQYPIGHQGSFYGNNNNQHNAVMAGGSIRQHSPLFQSLSSPVH